MVQQFMGKLRLLQRMENHHFENSVSFFVLPKILTATPTLAKFSISYQASIAGPERIF